MLFRSGEISVNASSEAELSLMNHLTRALLRTLEAKPDILRAADVLYLTQMMELTASATTASALAFTLPPSEAVVSIASKYLKLASLVLEPAVASRWLGLTEDGVGVGGQDHILAGCGLTQPHGMQLRMILTLLSMCEIPIGGFGHE